MIALAAIGAAFLSGRRPLVRPALVLLIAVCLVDWVLIEDFGFFGGLGTDPNSMIPVALVASRRLPGAGGRAGAGRGDRACGAGCCRCPLPLAALAALASRLRRLAGALSGTGLNAVRRAVGRSRSS